MWSYCISWNNAYEIAKLFIQWIDISKKNHTFSLESSIHIPDVDIWYEQFIHILYYVFDWPVKLYRLSSINNRREWALWGKVNDDINGEDVSNP